LKNNQLSLNYGNSYHPWSSFRYR